MPRHTTIDQIYRLAMATLHHETTVTLAEGETSDLPGTTKKVAVGPGILRVRAYRDGGMEVLEFTGAVGYARPVEV